MNEKAPRKVGHNSTANRVTQSHPEFDLIHRMEKVASTTHEQSTLITPFPMGLFDFLFGRKAPRQSPPSTSSLPASAGPLKPDFLHRFPFPIRTVPGIMAEFQLLELRREWVGQDRTPILLGDREHAERLLDAWDEPFDFEAQKLLALSTDVQQWFEQIDEENKEYRELDDAGGSEEERTYEEGSSPMSNLQVPIHYTGKPHDVIYLAEIPDEEAAFAPLHLRMGDWNACPAPHIHTAAALYWKERYGATIATVSSDVIEYTVERPPATDAEARKLAREQYLYCSDIVDQGVGSVATLAVALRHSTRWYFWWD